MVFPQLSLSKHENTGFDSLTPVPKRRCSLILMFCWGMDRQDLKNTFRFGFYHTFAVTRVFFIRLVTRLRLVGFFYKLWPTCVAVKSIHSQNPKFSWNWHVNFSVVFLIVFDRPSWRSSIAKQCKGSVFRRCWSRARHRVYWTFE